MIKLHYYKLVLMEQDGDYDELAIREYSREWLLLQVLRRYREVQRYIDLDCVEGEVRDAYISVEPPSCLKFKELPAPGWIRDSDGREYRYDLDREKWVAV